MRLSGQTVLPSVRAACAAAAAVAGWSGCATATRHPVVDALLATVEVAAVHLDSATQSPVVLLQDLESGQVLPIWVGLAEAQAIVRALQGLRTQRPMTHDLLATLVRELNADVVEVRIRELRGDTYYAGLRLERRGGRGTLDLDSRPSDAIALALRVGAPIRVARQLLGEPPSEELLPRDERDEGAETAPTLGLTVMRATPELRRRYQLPARPGLLVARVSGAAWEAGLRRGDLIVQVNGAVLEAPLDLLRVVRETPEGHSVRLRYVRRGREADIEIRPSSLDVARPRLRVTADLPSARG